MIAGTATGLNVAGVGASAGGIDAMLPLFARLRPTGRIAFVVAQHMGETDHGELVTRLVARASALPVVLAGDGMPLRPDTVYLIPPGSDGRVKGGVLALCAPAEEHLSTPSVNALFASIAESARSRAVGIVLSGTGSDGTAGCRSIKAGGGLTFAQDPSQARFPGMPSAAIDAGVVDRVLTVEAIADALVGLFPGAAAAPVPAEATAREPGADGTPPPTPSAEQRELEELLRQVREATGVDFSAYKEETLLRRIASRKATLGMARAEDYRALIRRQPAELRKLQHLFLVSVSSLFRDRESFRALETALDGALAAKPRGEPVRVWVPGCAAGEECYTLAVILAELIATSGETRPVEIVGSDLSAEAIAAANVGAYRAAAFKEVDPALRERWFRSSGEHFEPTAELRSLVRFEQRDVLEGVPPGELDLVSCRNLLIYLKTPLQDRLVETIHRALRPRGLLFVGPSESLGFRGETLFEAVDLFHRVFRRRQ